MSATLARAVPVSVRHRDGWCATRLKKVPEADNGKDNQPTRCGYVVALPWGYERRLPTCPECLALLQ